MTRLGAATLGVVVLFGCAYYNTLYNSEAVFAEAETHRMAGRDSLAEARYLDVIRKTSEAYRARPSGLAVAETLLLLGRAQLRVGRTREAEAALREAAGLASTTALRAEVLVQLAAALLRAGDREGAVASLNEALGGGLVGPTRGEAYLLRARVRLEAGPDPEGWNDLDRAVAVDSSVVVEAGVERFRWGVHYRDLERARLALAGLLFDRSAAERRDTISGLVEAAAQRWSPSIAATLLGDPGAATWDRTSRSRLGLQRAELLHRAGDRTGAEDQAWQVARGRGEVAVAARLLLARWHLDGTRDVGDAQAVVPILLPVADDPRAGALLEAVEDLERYSGLGLDDPLGWFAAAEVARTHLQAPFLARGLYLAYADTDPGDAWAPKALLGALSVAVSEEDRSWLRGRLEAHRESPYVQSARGDAPVGIESLEEELQERLREIASR